MTEQGAKICRGIAAYLVVKQILNVFLGAGLQTLIIPFALTAVLLYHVKNMNYAAAVIIGLMALYYLPGNIKELPGSWLYLTEGILDFGAAALLVCSQEVKAYFNNNN